MHSTERADGHERFKKLCALAQANSLGMADQLELKNHLQICDSCREIYHQYAAIGSEGMAYLSGSYVVSEEAERWDHRETWQKLFASIQDFNQEGRFFAEF
jgi:anti-sigma factor ChrR (cupin superfamily)